MGLIPVLDVNYTQDFITAQQKASTWLCAHGSNSLRQQSEAIKMFVRLGFTLFARNEECTISYWNMGKEW